ncbi:FGGY-family carbohydrate kinase [Dongia rigui]|uniref:FGGY family carbohydrate kinase n=1 Tax=Dongia rigui TaxID=940149 RepID=A0ABU5E2K4_9PROT|nr:FGGY family carbohydrate kinase [Dongia rigui]MDY0873805.1 FGGY family carbohydrate kinase [Dongia rigui]
MAYLLGLDIGTTSTIGILIDTDGGSLGVESRPVTLHSDHANWSEEDPAQWWSNVGAICQALLKTTGIAAKDIAAVGVTGMLPTVILLNAKGQPLRRSIQQNDARATKQLDVFRQGMEEARFLKLSGTGYSQQLVGPKLMWLRENEPQNFAAAKHVVGASDYITSRLTGTIQVEHNWALESGFVGLASGNYDPQLVALAGIDPALLAPIRKSHEIVGQVTAEAATATGLAVGTPVVAGCADHVASAFICGAARNGDLVLKFGGAGDILLSSDKPVADRRLFLDYHIVPGLFFPNGCMASSGSFLNWIVANWGGGAKEQAQAAGISTHQWLDQQAVSVSPESGVLFLPYFLGEKTPLNDPHARGTLIGLGLNHDIRHVWRAALEGVVFGFRHHVETFRECGLSVQRVFAADGGAASDLWLQISADALGLPVTRIDRHPGSSLGAAFVAGFGIDAFKDWHDIADYVAPGRVFEPEARAHQALDRKYALWRDTYTRLQSLYPALG